jgi:hypothetical protein
MSNPFHDAYLKATDACNLHTPHSEAYELFELGRYYRRHFKEFEGIHRANGVYRSIRSGEAFRFNYDTGEIEAVQDVKIERSGRGR